MRTIICAALLCVALSSFGATYFVDYSGGSDANAGTSSGSPLKHAPGDPRASGNVPASLSAGDAVYFASSSHTLTNGGIAVNWSGASNAPITYASYGGGTAILTTGPNSATVSMNGFVASALRQWLVFSNIAFVDIGGIRPGDAAWSVDTDGCTTNLMTAPPGGSALSFPVGLSNSKIIDCDIQGVGTWTNASPLSGTQSVSGTGISIEGGTNVLITGCNLSYMRTGIRFQGTSTRWFSNLVISNNVIGEWMVWLIDGSAASGAARFEDIQIVKNVLKNKWMHDQSNWTGCNDAPHTDGIFLRNSGQSAVWLRTVIANNMFYSDAPSSSGGTAMIYLSEGGGGDCLVANNVSLNAHDSAFIQVAPTSRQSGGRTVWILHNTWLGGPRAIRVTGTNHTLFVQGNIFARVADGDTHTLANFEAWNPLESDQNVWFNFLRPSGTYYPVYKEGTGWPAGGGGWNTWDVWRTMGFDASSVYDDPEFIDYSNSTVTSRDLRISSTSPARGIAEDYAAAYSEFASWLETDFAGNPRVAPFDAGAYEYIGESPRTWRATTGRIGVVRRP